jgi:formate hydrogenlyase subunit 6/NADH:ubiquinone oxidoreductase subunit I
MLCPEKALTIRQEANKPALDFNPLKCTACGLCVNNCPQSALTLQNNA